MRAVGDKHRGTIRPEFDRSISIDFQGAKITSDTGFLLMREIDQRNPPQNELGRSSSQVEALFRNWQKIRRQKARQRA